MSGLYSILRTATTALNAESLGLQVSGNNLANVNSPGYAEETVATSDHGTGNPGDSTASVQQQRDALLDQQVVTETALTASLTAQTNLNAQVQAALGENIGSTAASSSSATATGSGLGNDLSAFFNGFQALAAAPTDSGARQAALQGADTLARDFNSTDRQLGQIQANLGTQLTGDTGDINTLLTDVANLNTQISRAEFGAPGTAVSLRDQRQADLEQLAGKISVQTSPSGGAAGQIDVTVTGAGGSPVTLVSGGQVTNPVTFGVAGLTAGVSATLLAPAGGEVAGLLTANGTVQSLRDQLTHLAAQVVTSVNTTYNPTGTTGDLFQATAGSEAATMAVTPGLTAAGLTVSGTANPGDNTIAIAVAALGSQAFATAGGDQIDGTFASNYAGVVEHLGNIVATANHELDDQTKFQSLVTQQRASVSGVSLDQELTSVMAYERAYQASSQVVSIVDSLLNTVITGMLGN